MPSNFTPITLDDAETYYAYWNRMPVHSIDYSLVNLWGWQQHYGLEWCFESGLCWIRQTCPCRTVWWAPVGDWNACDWNAVLTPGMSFIRVPEQLTALWKERLGGRIQAEPARGQWEYLYLADELARLPGNRFHKKKNQVNAFRKAYGTPDFHPVDDRMIEECLALQDTWCQWHDCEGSPSLLAENDAINRVLVNYPRFHNLCGGAIFIGEDMVAFCLGERLNAQTVGVHFEKGLNGIRGVYQTINNTFVLSQCEGATYINRAQDLDEEGLRQAKMTYNPADFLHKDKVDVLQGTGE